MTDFLARENEVLGDEFATPTATGGSFATATGGDIDFESAAAAFPDISLDGSGDIPPPISSVNSHATSGGFSFDDFSAPPADRSTDVKVTGDDEISKFESEFPELDIPAVRKAPTFASDCMHIAKL